MALLTYEQLEALNLKKGTKVLYSIDRRTPKPGIVLSKRTKTISGGKFFNGRYWQQADPRKVMDIRLQPAGADYTICEHEFTSLEVMPC